MCIRDRLTAEGLVEATAQRGFRVTSATEDDLRDIALVRSQIEKLALMLSIEHGNVEWEGRVIAAHHKLQKAEQAVASAADDLVALQWDEACRVFSATLIDACDSPRLIDLHRKFFDQSRRYRLAQLREGQLNFLQRKKRHQELLEAALSRNTEQALMILQQEIDAELRSEALSLIHI